MMQAPDPIESARLPAVLPAAAAHGASAHDASASGESAHGAAAHGATMQGVRAGFGIGARLGAAFLAVAVLAAAANLIVEHGVSIERTTRVERTLPAVPVVAARAPIPIAAPMPSPPVPAQPSPDALLAAARGFETAVADRSARADSEAEAQYQRARATLSSETNRYTTAARESLGAAFAAKLAAQSQSLGKRAEEAIRESDHLRTVSADYAERFAAINTRVKSSVERSFKIFGRVITHQYLIELGNELDEIRQRFENLNGDGGHDKAAADALSDAESAFAATFKANQASLLRSQGADWIARTREDFERIVALRGSLISADAQRRRSLAEVSQESAKFSTLARKKAAPVKSRAAARPAPASAAATSVAATASATLAALPAAVTAPITPTARAAPAASVTPAAATAGSAVPMPTVREHSEIRQLASPDDHRRVMIAWISAAVLALLIFICVGTVVSIVAPVRRLLNATARIASGDVAARVPRGGIKELDTLAVAFNQMADRLSAAQEITLNYQQHLKAKVDERTQQLQQLAEHDPLTLLPNRRQLFALLNEALDAAAGNGRYVGVFFLDLDNFKNINDSMGHAFGDRVLIAIAERLRSTAQGFGFAARLGGDEFTVVYADAGSVEEVREAGWALVRAFQVPLLIDQRELVISVSIGASIFPDHERDAEALLRAADAALFRAKALGRSQLNVFTPDLLAAASAKFTTEQGLRRAVERGEFELVFQPEVKAETLRTGLVEALLRWRLPDGRYAPPGEFLSVAEESGLIMEISDWVLRSAIEAASQWHHGAWPEARVAINVSPRQLFDSGFVDRICALLKEYSLPAHCIEIELTETVLQTGSAIIDSLHRLRSHGIAIALDDFGTGYSSLASLEQLPLSRIKLDRSLIASIDTSARSAAIARAIIGLCHGLGLEVTAEGIERHEQLAMLIQNRSMYLQGYLLSRPVSRNELIPSLEVLHQRMQLLVLSTPTTAQLPSVSDTSTRLRLMKG